MRCPRMVREFNFWAILKSFVHGPIVCLPFVPNCIVTVFTVFGTACLIFGPTTLFVAQKRRHILSTFFESAIDWPIAWPLLESRALGRSTMGIGGDTMEDLRVSGDGSMGAV